ncbi:MAG: outer membrane beta-barrel protein [bacterium]
MKAARFSVASLALMIATPFALAAGQMGAQKSRGAGVFLGGGLDGSSIVVYGDPTVQESGGGVDLTLGYGFSPHWSLYTELNASQMTAAGGGDYSLAHFDLGTRVHFRAGPHTVVPFLQIAITGRATVSHFGGTTNTSSGGGISLGTGLNVHFTPAVALSTAIMWTLGSFDTFKVDDRTFDGSTVVAGSTRVHFGVVWFPQSRQ